MCSLGTRNPARSLRVGTLALRSLMALVELVVLSLAAMEPRMFRDCTFVTSIKFLLKRLEAFGIEANIFPLAADL